MNLNSFETPILFLIFNRPELTKAVFNQIKIMKPKKLYISADGPRLNNPTDTPKCEQARKIVESVDWDCDLRINFSKGNKGCKYGVSSGISWFFENEEYGIILEDDCLPDISFFYFCSELLEKYKDDTRIGAITGYNYLNEVKTNDSYFFASIGGIWGWATWRRVWKDYDVEIKNWNLLESRKAMKYNLSNRLIYYFFKYKFDLTYKGLIDTWDYQFFFLKLINNWLTIVPRVNLVRNIGFSDEGTHTNDFDNLAKNYAHTLQSRLKHPSMIVPNRKYDRSFLIKYTNYKSLLNFLKNKI